MSGFCGTTHDHDGLVSKASGLFEEAFGSLSRGDDKSVGAFAPGRVNIIGEHTDYNDGFVMPCALTLRTVVVGKLSSAAACRIASCNTDTRVDFTADANGLEPPLKEGKRSWGDYVRGVVMQYADEIAAFEAARGCSFAFDAAFASNVPLGGGLSSSASLEVATAALLEQLLAMKTVDPVARALRCVEAEHSHAHVPCGIMDQTISSCAKEGHLMLIDCRSKELTPVAIADPSISIVIANSNVTHSLTGSEYPDRVNQCAEAVEHVRRCFPESAADIRKLRDVTIDMLDRTKSLSDMSDLCYRRARHSISEDARTMEAVRACASGDFKRLGKMMLGSHESLRDDYEVSTSGLDLLVELAMQFDGVYGSRMTGGGFGGCTVTLVRTDRVDALVEHLQKEYKARTGVVADCFTTTPGPGAGVMWSGPQ